MDSNFKNKIAYIISIFFLVTGTALVLHHHDIPLKLAECYICKVKHSLTGQQFKNPVDKIFRVTNNSYRIIELLPLSPGHICDRVSCKTSSIHLLTDSNKSPPPSLS